MNVKSIKTKVVVSMICAMLFGAAYVIFLAQNNFDRNAEALADQSVKEAQSMFAVASAREAGQVNSATSAFISANATSATYAQYGSLLGSLLRGMKSETGDEYGLMLDKKFVKQDVWASLGASMQHRNNWDDSPDAVFLDSTAASSEVFKYSGKISTIPDKGTSLEQYHSGDSVYVRGMFPLRDATGNRIGAIFVMHDISSLYASMLKCRSTSTIFVICGGIAWTIILLTSLHFWVFRRLKRITNVATRVVGGDFGTEITVTAEDEVGNFERLFEQFRKVFVDVLSHVPELQE